MNVLILGAGGPVAAAAIRALQPYHRLRLADVKPLDFPEHETLMTDITSPQAVIEAAQGMDAIINCTVIRHDPVKAFDVNTRGAYNVMKAAVTTNIRRVIHTGPHLTVSAEEYTDDFNISEDSPPRPGVGLYSITKYLGQEVCRVFAETYNIQVICLLFCGFRPKASGAGLGPFIVSWDDAGEAFRCTLEVEQLPRSFEIFHIVADLPLGKYPNTKAKTLLGFHPKDTLEYLWRR
jgi:nucleoside-diphosphate-sugar epimerase